MLYTIQSVWLPSRAGNSSPCKGYLLQGYHIIRTSCKDNLTDLINRLQDVKAVAVSTMTIFSQKKTMMVHIRRKKIM